MLGAIPNFWDTEIKKILFNHSFSTFKSSWFLKEERVRISSAEFVFLHTLHLFYVLTKLLFIAEKNICVICSNTSILFELPVSSSACPSIRKKWEGNIELKINSWNLYYRFFTSIQNIINLARLSVSHSRIFSSINSKSFVILYIF